MIITGRHRGDGRSDVEENDSDQSSSHKEINEST